MRPDQQGGKNLGCVLGAIIFVVAALIVWLAVSAEAQERHHPPEHQAIHEKFYSTWNMPDNPNVSRCSNQDCSPVASRFEDGKWFARRNDDGHWVVIPPSKIELNRDAPDGRSHLCGRGGLSGDFVVFCFVAGVSG